MRLLRSGDAQPHCGKVTRLHALASTDLLQYWISWRYMSKEIMSPSDLILAKWDEVYDEPRHGGPFTLVPDPVRLVERILLGEMAHDDGR